MSRKLPPKLNSNGIRRHYMRVSVTWGDPNEGAQTSDADVVAHFRDQTGRYGLSRAPDARSLRGAWSASLLP
jgi:hypothetical protein